MVDDQPAGATAERETASFPQTSGRLRDGFVTIAATRVIRRGWVGLAPAARRGLAGWHCLAALCILGIYGAYRV